MKESNSMEEIYHPQSIETEAQQSWEANKSFEVPEQPGKEPYSWLAIVPNPGGRLHMGHVRNRPSGDVVGRCQRRLGRSAMRPMGWGARGRAAENAAIKNKVAPAEWTCENIEYVKGQRKRRG